MTPDGDAKSSYPVARDAKPTTAGMYWVPRFALAIAQLTVAAAMVWMAVTAWRQGQDIWFAIAVPLAAHAIARYAREDRT